MKIPFLPLLLKFFTASLAVSLFLGCESEQSKGDAKMAPACEAVKALSLSDAQNFGLDSCGGFRVLWVKNGKSSPLHWLLLDSLSPSKIPQNLSVYPQIRVPSKRIAILSSTYLGFLSALGAQENVVAVDTKKYIADSNFYAYADSVQIKEVGEGLDISPEAIYTLKADVIFAFSMGESVYDAFPKLARLKLPVVLTSEWLEMTPLAKAEWLKFFGVVTGHEAVAESLFALGALRYAELKQQMLQIPEKPTVFSGTPASGTWYASTGNGFMANLIRDAGGRYLWESDSVLETLSMPFEKAFADAQNATIWLNAGSAHSLDEILGRDERVRLLPVWKTGEIYEYDLRRGPGGGFDFYESAVVKPDSLLLDVAKVLHPTYFKSTKAKWYRKLSNI